MSQERLPDSPDTTKIHSDNQCESNISEKSVLDSSYSSSEQKKDNNDEKATFNIVRTIPNNSTSESNPLIFQSKILEYENLFTNRYTDENVEYAYESSKGITDPYISYNYGKRRFDYGNRNRSQYGNNKNDRSNNDRHRYENSERRHNNEWNRFLFCTFTFVTKKMEGIKTNINSLSNDEAELYDRQIRLWGLDAQNRLRNSSVLIVGLTGLGSEIAKTLLLCGIKSLCLYDNGLVKEDERISNFFLDFENKVNKKRSEAVWSQLKDLNPLVQIYIENNCLPTSEEFLQQFDLVIVIDQSRELTSQINKVCRELGINFQCGSVFGWIGYCFFDYNGKKFRLKKHKVDVTYSDTSEANKYHASDNAEEVIVDDDYEEKVVSYKSFEESFNFNVVWEKMSRKNKRLFPADLFILKACMTKKFDADINEQIEQLKEEYQKILIENNAENDENFRKNNFAEDKIKFYCNPQYGGTCSVVGGILGQQAISILSQNTLNIGVKNVFIYSSLSGKGSVHQIPM